MTTIYPETLDQLADRWTVLINQSNFCQSHAYPAALCTDVIALIRQTERMIAPDPFEQEQIGTARTLAESGDPKLALFKLHEVIEDRLNGRRS
ncbi:hypothetical protein [Caballeronia ptereochthonis]|uniref:Uncharacterized protein n=1 Tax=Caballeronia ptereochthonis TaxID=1777144 RepID=A0A158E7Z1_9BURK|nr:hypothetical protein [Caballeronia ptereochthonis]SAL02883.1 hypothetical protein AWB83_06676 [Caballeronia ptereochthonis]